MSPEFWTGFYYGVIAAALPLLGIMCWDANRRVQEYLRRAIEAGRAEGRTPGPSGVYPPPPAPPRPFGVAPSVKPSCRNYGSPGGPCPSHPFCCCFPKEDDHG